MTYKELGAFEKELLVHAEIAKRGLISNFPELESLFTSDKFLYELLGIVAMNRMEVATRYSLADGYKYGVAFERAVRYCEECEDCDED